VIDLIPAKPSMASRIRLQPDQIALGQIADEATLAAAIQNGIAMAVVDGDTILAVGGIVTMWEGRGSAWGLLAPDIRQTMAPIHRIVERVLDTSPLRRIEAQVAVGHRAGQRWVRMLGFEHEGTMRSFYADHDYDLFAKVK
jgi:hypothetical protein